MLQIKSILLIVILVPFEIDAQFRIVGLLNENQMKTTTNLTYSHQTNAQGRGFSVIDSEKRSIIRPNRIIRVHVIDDEGEMDAISRMNNILMIEKQKTLNKKIQKKEDLLKTNKTGKINKM